ncbi:hypothetical protein [Stenotrophomonas sp. AB1(2024)]|uniref:hypothetical protein n=1 Tax=Stenotrophomonas sp. AB1(2024) TaxID=3132215 RepID=UPI0030A571BF
MCVPLEAEGELEEYRRAVNVLRRKFSAYEARIVEILGALSSINHEDSAPYFDELHLIQRNIAIAKYKFEFPIGSRLDDFVCHMDRDDEYSRRYWHAKFVDGVKWPVE